MNVCVKSLKKQCILRNGYVMSLLCEGQTAVAYPGIFFGEVQQIHLRTEDREDGDLGAVAP